MVRPDDHAISSRRSLARGLTVWHLTLDQVATATNAGRTPYPYMLWIEPRAAPHVVVLLDDSKYTRLPVRSQWHLISA